MPYYDFKCSQCGKEFTLKQTFEEREHKRIKCPKCGSQKAERIIGTIFAKTSKKS